MIKPEPYYDADGITIFCGDCREVLPHVSADVVVTDPPYGIAYLSGKDGCVSRGIAGDETTELRDWLIGHWLPRPLACFATWHCLPPAPPRGCLVWHKATLGMGDLGFPWGPSFEMVWVYGQGWTGKRDDAVLTGETIVTWNSGPARRVHPNQKPIAVMEQIIAKAPGTILDPFMGSGTTLVASKQLGRRAIGIELEERYCKIAVKRLAQTELFAALAAQPKAEQLAIWGIK